jgi:hypothetical protein
MPGARSIARRELPSEVNNCHNCTHNLQNECGCATSDGPIKADIFKLRLFNVDLISNYNRRYVYVCCWNCLLILMTTKIE